MAQMNCRIKGSVITMSLLLLLASAPGGRAQGLATPEIRRSAGDRVSELIQQLGECEPLICPSVVFKLGNNTDSRAIEPLIDFGLRKGAFAKSKAFPILPEVVKALVTIGNVRALEVAVEKFQYCRDQNPRKPWQVPADWCYSELDLVRKLASAFKNEQRAIQLLMAEARRGNVPVVEAAYPFFIERGDRSTEPILVEALSKFGDLTMANAFLSCGNSVLAKAAREWAKERKDSVILLPGVPGSDLRWGSSK